MTRPLKRHKNFAELAIAALLTYETKRLERGKCPTIENLRRLQVDGLKLRVKATPDALVTLIQWCAQLQNFKQKQRKNLAAFQKFPIREQYSEIRDTIATLAKYKLIQDLHPRKQSDPDPMRDFEVILPYPLTSAEKQEQILSELFGTGKAWDRAESDYKISTKPSAQHRKTKEAVNPAQLAQQAFCRAMVAEVIPHFPARLSNYTLATLTSLAELISVLEAAIPIVASSDVSHHAALLVSLGRIYLAQQQLDNAQKLFEQCLDLASNSTSTADSFYWLGVIYHQRGDYENAQQHFTNGLERRIQLLGEKHPDVAASTQALAELYSDRGQFQEAEPLFDRALTHYKAIHGKKHSRVACVLNGLAVLYTQTHRLKEAEAQYEEAFKILTNLPDSEAYPHLANTQYGLANFYLRRGEYEKAEQFHQDAIEVLEQSYPANHPNLIVHKASLAVTHKALGRLNEAKKLYLECIQSLVSAYGDNHPKVAVYLSDLAWLMSEESSNPQELRLALSFFQKSVSILDRVYGPNHPSLHNARKGLNLLYARMRTSALTQDSQ
jgi:tetratricopeptide (TPR) repeat protein